MNRFLEAVILRVRAGWQWTQNRPRLGPVARVLRGHALELLAVVFLVALVVGVGPASLVRVLGHTRVSLLLLMLPVTLAMYLARSLAWWLTLRTIHVRVSLPHAVAVEFAGQTMVFMPTGDLARVALIKEVTHTRRSAGELTATIAFQELLYMTLIGLGVLPRVASHPDLALLVLVMVIAHGLILTVLTWKPAYEGALRVVERIRLLRRFDSQLRSIRPAFVELLRSPSAIGVLLCNIAAVLLSYYLFYLALHAIGQEVGFIAAAFVLSLSFVLAGLSLIPGGVGPFEGLLTVLMVANGVPAAAGAAAGLLFRVFNDVLMAAVGAVLLVLIRRGRIDERPRGRRRTGRAAGSPRPREGSS